MRIEICGGLLNSGLARGCSNEFWKAKYFTVSIITLLFSTSRAMWLSELSDTPFTLKR